MQQTKGGIRGRVGEPNGMRSATPSSDTRCAESGQSDSAQPGYARAETNPVDNRARVVESLWRHPGSSRIELANILGLDKSTLSRSAARLLDEGMVEELTTMDSGPKGGRPAIGLAVRGDWGLWLGLELQPDGLFAVLVDLAGEIRDSFRLVAKVHKNSLNDVLLDSHAQAVERAEVLGIRLIGTGLSVPGPIRPGSGIVERSRPLGIESPLDLASIAGELLGVDVSVENDVKCCCRGETHFSSRTPAPNFLYLLAEERVKGMALGLGIVIDGKIYRGDHGAGGEIMSIYSTEGSDQLSLSEEELTLAASDASALASVVAELAPQVAFIANTLDIDRIILGGLFASHFPAIKPLFEQELARRRTYPTLAASEVLRACRDEEAPAFGAALYFTENLSAQSFWRKS